MVRKVHPSKVGKVLNLLAVAYSIILPGDLPPSHRGRSVNFRYNLSVGINCSSSPIQSSRHQRCRLIHVPIRLYNNVAGLYNLPLNSFTSPTIMKPMMSSVLIFRFWSTTIL